MALTTEELHYIQRASTAQTEAIVELAQSICGVAAPTGEERERAQFVASLFKKRGYEPEIDEIGNVYTRRGKRGKGPVLLFLAHIDTVFPAHTPLAIRREGNTMYGPGLGDNSLSVASMISLFDLLDNWQRETASDIVAVANVGEEGLGNLRGARAAVERYRSELGSVIAIDGALGHIVTTAVGSKRWRITVKGPGGHSYGAFGLPSAIHGLGRIIAKIADLSVPSSPKTTFNVGIIEGGTSINTIAASASALLDMRSIDVAALERLAQEARSVIMSSAGAGLQTEIEVLGERPAGRRELDDPLVQLATKCLRGLEIEPKYTASSTDANIPISMNIPAVCIGISKSEGTHTVNERVSIPPISAGMAQLTRLCIEASAQIAS